MKQATQPTRNLIVNSALFVSHTGEKSGAEIFMLDLLRSGPEEWRACFLSSGQAVDELSGAGRPPVVLTAGTRMLSIRRNSSLSQILAGLKDVWDVSRQLANVACHYDVICANSQKALFVCALASWMTGKPLIWILHDIISDPAFSSANRRAALLFARLFARLVVVNSLETGRAFVACGGDERKVRLIYNGFDADTAPVHSAGRGESLRKIFGLDSRPVIGLFGRLSAWKGQHVLIKALVEVPQAQAIIVGGALFGQDAYEAEIKQLTHDLGLTNRVHFLGFRQDVPELMASVDVVVHASTAPEPFGRVVVEGMLAGRPVIAVRGGGVTEIIADGETGLLVPPDNAPAIGSAIRRVLTDPELAHRLASAGRADAASRFSLSASRAAIGRALAEAHAG